MRDSDLVAAVLAAVSLLALPAVAPLARALRRIGAPALGELRRCSLAVLAMARDTGSAVLARRAAAGLLGSAAGLLALSAPARAAAAPPSATALEHDLPVRPEARAAAAYDVVVVRPGDTLWDIARRHLPAGASDASIARAWPRWYAANRAVIGSDPDLLLPGQRLRSPDRRPTGTSSSQHPSPARPAEAVAPATSFDPDRR